MKISNKKLGILGGIGPYASCDWYKKLLDICQKKFDLEQDYEYPEVYIVTAKMAGWSERGIEDMELAKFSLFKAIDKLTQLKVDYIIIACNTVHCLYEELQNRTIVPIINLVNYCVEETKKMGYKSVSVLSSATTIKYGLYSYSFSEHGINEVRSGRVIQKDIDKAIWYCQRGDNESSFDILYKNILTLKAEGASAVILGCTELPLAATGKIFPIPVIDPGSLLLNYISDLLYENVSCVNA